MVADSGNKGFSRDFADLFYSPTTQDLGAYNNIYEYNMTNDNEVKCGYFICDMWANQGAYLYADGKRYDAIDSQGNAIFWVAELCLNKERHVKKQGKQDEYTLFLTQRCKTPSEAFSTPKGAVFPVADLIARDATIKMSNIGYEGLRVAGELVEVGSKVVFRPDLEGKLEPIDTYIINSAANREGCLLRYEAPLTINGLIPEGAYLISVDPIGQNTSGGKSLTSIIVMKTPKFSNVLGPEKIVATYRGRNNENPQGYVHELLMKLSTYYNAMITYENDRDGGIYQYFLRKGQLKRLMSKPAMTLDKYISGSKTNLREYGHSMGSARHKQIGENLLLE